MQRLPRSSRPRRPLLLAAAGLACSMAASGLLPTSAARAASAAAAPAAAASAPAAPGAPLALAACRLKGVPNEARCGILKRPLDPARPTGTQIDLHVAVIPALARHKRDDAVFFFAGGPGQSAIDLAGMLVQRYGRLGTQRDLVLVDQRGTGRSAPLKCATDDPRAPWPTLAQTADLAQVEQRMAQCREQLARLPHGDLRHYATTVAMADIEAVRVALQYPRINLIGGSYGTRAVLEYLRQQPQRVRRAIADGLAPADIVLPASFSPDNQAALDALFTHCETDAACRLAHPDLRGQWRQLMSRLPQTLDLAHPATGQAERLTMTPLLAAGLLRGPLYAPALAAGLPAAMSAATQGRWAPLMALGMALQAGDGMASGMHFSVVCAEDWPRMGGSTDRPGPDFGDGFAQVYDRVCRDWPRGTVDPAFYTLPRAAAPVLLLSGGIDPATPPRHGERAAQALGPLARHVVVPNAGHGTTGLPCLRDQLLRFIGSADDATALKLPLDCAASMPRPPAFRPLAPPMAAQVAKAGASR